MTSGESRQDELTPVEQALVGHVERGDLFDLLAGKTADDAVDEDTMRAWGEAHTVRSWVIRDIVRGRLAPDPDPHGLRLRGGRISGRLDLDNVISTVGLELNECLMDEGMSARDAELASIVLNGCVLKHHHEVPLDADRTTASALVLDRTVVLGHTKSNAVSLRSTRLGRLTCHGTKIRNDSGAALDGYRLRADQYVTIGDGFEAIGAGTQGAVRLVSAHLGQLDIVKAKIRNDTGPALFADGLQVDGGVFLRDGFEAVSAYRFGSVRLPGAHLGQLDCRRAKIRNDHGPALSAVDLRVDSGVLLHDGFDAVGAGDGGAVCLARGHVGYLDCTGAKIRNDSGPALDASVLHVDNYVVLGDGFVAVGAGAGAVVELGGTQIGGAIEFDPTQLEHHTDPAHRLDIDGLTYTGLPRRIHTHDWLQLLREATPEYAAQPYHQLAAAHRAAGHEREVRRILIAQRRDQLDRRALTGRAERAWARTTGLLLGYGYRPWRAFIGLVATITLAIVLALTLGEQGLAQVRAPLPTAPCTVVERIGVGLDLGTPLITTGTRTRCDTTNTTPGYILTVTGWVLRILAWGFATLFIAGFTGAVRKT